MTSIVKDLIEYCGISDCIPDNPYIFKRFNLSETIILPKQKLDISQLVTVSSKVNINSSRIIRTPIGTSLDGQKLTGWKLIVEGQVNQKIKYVANLPSKPLHSTNFSIPFSTFITLPQSKITPNYIDVIGYIEDIYVEIYDNRNIFNNIILLFNVII